MSVCSLTKPREGQEYVAEKGKDKEGWLVTSALCESQAAECFATACCSAGLSCSSLPCRDTCDDEACTAVRWVCTDCMSSSNS